MGEEGNASPGRVQAIAPSALRREVDRECVLVVAGREIDGYAGIERLIAQPPRVARTVARGEIQLTCADEGEVLAPVQVDRDRRIDLEAIAEGRFGCERPRRR